MNKEDEEEKETHLELNTILNLDKPKLKHKENKLELNNNEKFALNNKDQLKSNERSELGRNSEMELKQALDLLKSLKPNQELIKAIELIEGVIKREQDSLRED